MQQEQTNNEPKNGKKVTEVPIIINCGINFIKHISNCRLAGKNG